MNLFSLQLFLVLLDFLLLQEAFLDGLLPRHLDGLLVFREAGLFFFIGARYSKREGGGGDFLKK